MVKHTPGPWYAVGSWVEHANDEVPDICNCDPESMGQAHLGRSDAEIVANTRLIAAAPFMLETLKTISRHASILNEKEIKNLCDKAVVAAKGKKA